jgi:hypothetical protein
MGFGWMHSRDLEEGNQRKMKKNFVPGTDIAHELKVETRPRIVQGVSGKISS